MVVISDNILKWFRNEFIPNCSDMTIAALIFLYDKYGEELKNDMESREFVKQKKEQYLKTPVAREK